MNTSEKLQHKIRAILLLMCCVAISSIVRSQNIDFDTDLLKHEFNFNVGASVNQPIGIVSPDLGANAFWQFNSTPPGATLDVVDGFVRGFTLNGITVNLPAGVSDSNPVPQSATAQVTNSGTLIPGLFEFTILITNEDATEDGTRTFAVKISQPMDLVLVLDRSGSMGTTIMSSGVTRWQALTTAVSNFANLYQSLGRDADRVSLTYFDTDLNPFSACCNGLTSVTNTIANTINADITAPANNPGGYTALGSGLINATGKLTDNTKARSVIVFTDGRQNRQPEVNSDGNTYSNGNPVGTGINIYTIGIDTDPNATYHMTLQALSTNHNGTYNTTNDGSTFTFAGGDLAGSLSGGFTEQFVELLSEASPQIVKRSSTRVSSGAAPFTLQSFSLNKEIDKLLLEISVDKKFEVPQLAQLLARIQLKKNNVLVNQYIKPSWVGNYTNTILLTIDFKTAASLPPIASEGDWTVTLADVSLLKINYCNVTTIVDDHRLNITKEYPNGSPKVNDAYPMKVTLDWLGAPITDATVEAVVLRPGEDIGDLLANHPLAVDVSSAPDAGNPGTQKFEQLWATDSTFRNALKKTENAVTLAHTADGKYEGTFNGLTNAGVYRVMLRISGSHTEAGKYERVSSSSFYTSFSSIDMEQSGVVTQTVGGLLHMDFRPFTTYGKFVGPAMGDGFMVDNSAIKIDTVMDHQDGRYTIIFSGDISEETKLTLLGQEIYAGVLVDIGSKGGFLDWLKSLGIPIWLFWLLLILLIVIIIWIILRKKN